jgi:transcription-repair coupling factor (superfamily II helicase)
LKPLPSLLPPGSLLILDSPETFPLLDERFRQIVQRQFAEYAADAPGLHRPDALYATLKEVEGASAAFTQVHHTLVIDTLHGAGISFHTTSFETTKPSLEHYVTQIRKRLADDFTVSIVCDNEGQAQRMDEMLRENEIGSVIVPGADAKPGKGDDAGARDVVRRLRAAAPFEGFRDIIITTGPMHSGFVFPEAQLYIITDREIFGRYRRRHVYRKIYKGAPIADAREIRKGDFVVHLDHGIGRFEGIRTQNVDGKITDFLELIYADNDKLLVPVEKIAYVHKFSGPEQAEPQLDKLGTKKWLQRRRKSQEAIENLAKDLLGLYARRASARGYTYEPDTPWQHEFEASFIYTETPDQLRAIEEVKNDMRSDKPMDRLVCGDVGYGKTEVAIRAAFKAIQDRKQVALLCPTTILAQQHFNTFRERFADYPIRVEMISRFRTAKETKDIFAEARAGKIDMIVGTHALLSKSAQFRDLGLVIVDEEQRFGVQQKERLKELRTSVDFLTLTATPIPRTLYMALSGLRDMSLINTPPADRHPIKTRVIHFDAEQIEEAILRELNRGGQVFFVHNRVHSIHQVADRVKEIVPSARIAVAHGQMPDQELEDVMLHFVDGKIDILVSTTIIENGVDIPNVNTIIVNRADAFGLAQLYQLRGRVGRENRRAYAYLIVPAGQAITEQAVARLAAIEEFTELGMGFNIAMRDMEIRGAGNLLGREQHGSMNDVGFELYCRMLEEAVEAMRGNVHEEEAREVEIQWKVSAHIPQSFVPVESQRVMLYKRVAEVRTLEELDEVADEMRDRYGEVRREAGGGDAFEALPEPVENLLAVARLRLRGRRLAIRKIALTQGGFKLYREDAVRELGPGARKVIKNGVPKIYTDDPGALEFHYANWNTRRQLHEAASVLAVL